MIVPLDKGKLTVVIYCSVVGEDGQSLGKGILSFGKDEYVNNLAVKGH